MMLVLLMFYYLEAMETLQSLDGLNDFQACQVGQVEVSVAVAMSSGGKCSLFR